MGLLDEQREQIQPDQTMISLDFPLLASHSLLPAPTIEGVVTLCDWSQDIAIITLAEQYEIAQKPCPFLPAENGESPQMWGHEFRAFGFPVGEEKGVWAAGKLMDENANRTIQLEGVQAIGKAVVQGFSGTPVWDDKHHGIVGLMVQVSRNEDERVAYMIPLPTLQKVVGELPTAPTMADQAYLARQAYCHLAEEELAQKIEEELEAKFVELTLMKTEGKGKYATPSSSESDRSEDLQELMGRCSQPVLMLLGAPGSGKSVLLERLQLQISRDGIGEPNSPIPFFARLNQYRGDVLPLKWLTEEWEERYPEIAETLPFEKILRQNRLILLLDGLNEIPHKSQVEYDEKSQQWSKFIDRKLKGNRALFSCRTLDYSTVFDEACQQVEIQQIQVEPLSPDKILDFLTRYKPNQADRAWRQIEGNKRLIDLYAVPFFLKLLIDQLGEDGKVPQGRATLITGHVWDALYRECQIRKSPAVRKIGLLSDYDLELITDKAWDAESFELPIEGELIPALIQLAYDMQKGMGKDGGVVSLLKPEAMRLLKDCHPSEVIGAGIQLNLLTQERVKKSEEKKRAAGIYLRFTHQLFQEYLAAQRLKNSPEPEKVTVEHRAERVSPETYLEEIAKLDDGMPVSALPTTGWEETMILAAGMVADPNGLMSQLMEINLPLAGRCALSSEVHLSPRINNKLIIALRERLTDEAYDVRSRMNAGLVLGELGDPRFEAYGEYLLSPFVSMTGGSYRIGDSHGLYADEKPANDVVLEPFEIAVYPVTNGEYRKFIEVGGYEDEQWWETPAAKAWLRGESTAEGERQTWRSNRKHLKSRTEEQIRALSGTSEVKEQWIIVRNWSEAELESWLDDKFPQGATYRTPLEWHNSRFNGVNQPVVGVCWFEARAYCCWLSSVSGRNITLPSEAEWEASARHNRPDGYPYGPNYLVDGGNTGETHLLQTTPIGIFPKGKTVEGLHDMSGNVYEWTISLWGEDSASPDFKYPYSERLVERENLAARDAIWRVVRGGSWPHDNRAARSAYRSRYFPSNRSNNFGFRLVRRPRHYRG